MPWAVAVGVVVAGIAHRSGSAAPDAEPARTDCDGCGAPLEAGRPTCTHCRRPRKGAEPSPGYSYKGADRWPTPDLTPAPSPSFYTPAPSPAYEPPAPAPDFSSGGGGDFGGGGASGEF